MSIIECHQLSKHYRNRLALDGLDLRLESGKIIGLVGPNGSGKSTLLRIMGSFDQDYEGQVLIDGKKPGPEARMVTSYLPDELALSKDLSVERMIKLYRDFFPDFDQNKAFEMIRFFKLDPRQKLKEMSKGMKEKVQIAMVISRRAKIYLLDEPISGVDPAARKVIMQNILTNYSSDSLLIISSHLLQDLEPIIDEVIFLDDGRIYLHEAADDLRARYQQSLNNIFEEVFQ